MSLVIDIRKELNTFPLEVSLTAQDETVGFLGASGCGKSMTLRCIAGVETPDEGKIIVNGETYFDSAAKINLSPQKRKTALLFQNFQLFPHLTVEQNIAAGISRDMDSDARAAEVQCQLDRFQLKGFEKRFPAFLSGGQQQRVALARMLAAKPGILMLDEPFSALDSHLKGVLEQNLVSLFDAYHGTVLYISHDIDEALRFCDRIAVVEKGHIMEVGTGDDLVHHPQSMAGIKLSGCKNATEAQYVSDHCVYLPKWGVQVQTQEVVPRDISTLGVRAFYLERASGPGENCFHVRVDSMSDSRFERTLLLGFLDRAADAPRAVDHMEGEMKYLHQHLFWRVDKLKESPDALPQEGEELWIRIPSNKVYLVSR